MMWFQWLKRMVQDHLDKWTPGEAQPKVDVVCRTKDGREFAPFSIEWRGSTLVLCENEEADDA